MEEEWISLGYTLKDSNEVGGEIESMVKKLREIETHSFEIIHSDDKEALIALPAIAGDQAVGFQNDIAKAFAKKFPPILAGLFTEKFIETHRSTLGGITGSNRIVKVSIGDVDSSGGLDLRYNIVTRVLSPGITIAEASEDFDRYTQHRGQETIDQLPVHWMHIFSDPDSPEE